MKIKQQNKEVSGFVLPFNLLPPVFLPLLF